MPITDHLRKRIEVMILDSDDADELIALLDVVDELVTNGSAGGMAINEFLLDNTQPANASTKTYPTPAAAVAAGHADPNIPAGAVIRVRVREGQGFTWDWTGFDGTRSVVFLTGPRDGAFVDADNPVTEITVQGPAGATGFGATVRFENLRLQIPNDIDVITSRLAFQACKIIGTGTEKITARDIRIDNACEVLDVAFESTGVVGDDGLYFRGGSSWRQTVAALTHPDVFLAVNFVRAQNVFLDASQNAGAGALSLFRPAVQAENVTARIGANAGGTTTQIVPGPGNSTVAGVTVYATNAGGGVCQWGAGAVGGVPALQWHQNFADLAADIPSATWLEDVGGNIVRKP